MNSEATPPAQNHLPLPHFFSRIEEKSRCRAAAPVLMVALGDSVTQGIAGVDELLHEQVYHAQLQRQLQSAFPLCVFSRINAGVDGHRAQDGLARLDRDVIRHQPDLTLIAFALNDAALGGLDAVETFARNIESLIQRIRADTPSDIVLVTPNMMLTRPNDAIPEKYQQLTDDFLQVQNDGVLARYAEAIVEVGEKTAVPVADVYRRWRQRASNGVDTTTMLANGLNHPDAAGHALAADVLFKSIKG